MRVYTRRGGGVGVSGGLIMGFFLLAWQLVVWMIIALVYVVVAVLALAGGAYLRFKAREDPDRLSIAQNTSRLWRGMTKGARQKVSKR